MVYGICDLITTSTLLVLWYSVRIYIHGYANHIISKDKSEWRRRLSKTYGPRDTERILEGDYGSCDTGTDIPKLIIDTTSQVGMEKHVREEHGEFHPVVLPWEAVGKIPISELASGYTDCKMSHVEKVTAHLPTTIKHWSHEHELALNNCTKVSASGLTLKFCCNGCGGKLSALLLPRWFLHVLLTCQVRSGFNPNDHNPLPPAPSHSCIPCRWSWGMLL